jgi:hypothetical protein
VSLAARQAPLSGDVPGKQKGFSVVRDFNQLSPLYHISYGTDGRQGALDITSPPTAQRVTRTDFMQRLSGVSVFMQIKLPGLRFRDKSKSASYVMSHQQRFRRRLIQPGFCRRSRWHYEIRPVRVNHINLFFNGGLRTTQRERS